MATAIFDDRGYVLVEFIAFKRFKIKILEHDHDLLRLNSHIILLKWTHLARVSRP